MTKKGGKQKGGRHKNAKDAVERKRDERTQRNKLKNERKQKEFHGGYTDDDFNNFKRQLDHQGLKLREIQGDGNCLFRALADQLNGDDKLHTKHRREVVEYMKSHKEDFAPFLDDTVTFEKYLQNLGSAGTYGGNDSVVAFARKNSVDVVIHQFNSPTFIVNGKDGGCLVKLHLAYHSMEHYSSIRTKDDPGDGPAHMFHRSKLLQKPQSQSQPDEKLRKTNKLPKNTTNDFQKTEADSKINEKVMVDKHDDFDEKVNSIKTTTGFQDEEQIKVYFHDNGLDIDATLSLIFQVMTLTEPSDDQTEIQNDVFSSETKASNLIKQSKEGLDEENNDDDINGLLKWLIDSVVEAEEGPVGNEQEAGPSITNQDACEDCQYNNIKSTGNPKKGKQGVVKKPNNRSKISNRSKHLSNRQRKELLKQERKKRREENKRDPGNSKPSGDDGEDGDSPLTPADIQVISI